jgi:Protein of unknown function (DUF3987)
MSAPYDAFAAIVDALPGSAERRGVDEVRTECVHHHGQGLNLAIYRHAVSNHNKVGIKCYSQDCDPADVLAALGLSLSHAYYDHEDHRLSFGTPELNGFKVKSPKLKTYEYLDAQGVKVGWVTRDKTQHTDEGELISKTTQGRYIDGVSVAGLKGMTLPLFGLPTLLSSRSATAYVVEGERDAVNLTAYFEQVGFQPPIPVTTTPGGAGHELIAEWVEPMRRFEHVHVIVDRDAPGYRRGFAWHEALPGTALVFEPSKGKDVSDVLERVRGGDDLGEFFDHLTPTMLLDRVGDVGQLLRAWEQPQPIAAAPVEPFPTQLDHGPLTDMAQAVASSLSLDTGMPFLQGLAAVSAAIQGMAEIEIKPDWVECGTIWPLPLAESGQMKTASYNAMLGPLLGVQRAERDADADFDVRRQQWESLTTAQRKAQDAYGKAVASGDPAKITEAEDRLRNVVDALQLTPEPFPFRLAQQGGDVTSEALGQVLAQHGERIAVIAHEGGFVDILAGLYGDGRPKLDLLLLSYDGSGRDEDRIGREGHNLERPVTTVCLSPQPSVLAEHSRNPSLRGRGLWARFTPYEVPMPDVIDLRGAAIPDAAAKAYEMMLVRTVDAYKGRTAPLRFELDRRGAEIVMDMRRELYVRALDGGDLEAVRDFANKAAGKVARIALKLFHGNDPAGSTTRPWDRPTIPVEYIVIAAAIVRVSLTHGQKLMRVLRMDPVAHAAIAVAATIERAHPTALDARLVQQWLHKRWRGDTSMTADHARRVLDLLDACGWIRPQVTTSRGRVTAWDVNPLAFVPHA